MPVRPERIVNPAGRRVDSSLEWRAPLVGFVCGATLFLTVSGLALFILPFSVFNQVGVLVHTAAGLIVLGPTIWYIVRHWTIRRGGNLSHYQLLGYLAAVVLLICLVSGVVVTVNGVVGPRLDRTWDLVHLITGLVAAVLVLAHLLSILVRRMGRAASAQDVRRARRRFGVVCGSWCAVLLGLCAAWTVLYDAPRLRLPFSDAYSWRFGEERPFAPSLAVVDESPWGDDLERRVLAALGPDQRQVYLTADTQRGGQRSSTLQRIRDCVAALDLTDAQQADMERILAEGARFVRAAGAVAPAALARSDGCGTSGCHGEIYAEWAPSAHRYSSMDDLFQRVQSLMVAETSPEHTRYCAGCHDPISLFGGAKDADHVTLSAEGAHEGISCLVCHSIVQTDVQGNADYTIQPQQRYVYELHDGALAKFVSDFLIRTYPTHHTRSYSRALYKTPEFCGACHKQYMDREVNTDIGKVQGQNQYDSWKNSRWHHADDPSRTVTCRECHMPLVASRDPAAGDALDANRRPNDGMHRSHRTLGSNQYVPTLHDLPGAERHVALTEAWLRGEIEIPEIAARWTTGPVIRMELDAPPEIRPGQRFTIQAILTNNKTGHDFPTGPLDMIESWVELSVTDDAGRVVYHVGDLDDRGAVRDSPIWLKADGFDRDGELIDRHNLWDLVGKKYHRSLFPGVTDTLQVEMQCPSMARGRVSPLDDKQPTGRRVERFETEAPTATDAAAPSDDAALHVHAMLWYRKANPEFLDRVYGQQTEIRSHQTLVAESRATIRITADDPSEDQ
ncbi:MAG: hypothetical protein KDA25_00265 [Phycisphaerales bacterium]|nr:hypothetical protein [Phycisphaerales bacterium]